MTRRKHRFALGVVLVAAGLTLALYAQPQARPEAGAIRLIVQGDDMGVAHGINLGTIKAYKEGVLRVTNVMTPGNWMPEAARLLAENPGLEVGVHLTLTAEWSDVKWRPLTIAPTLVDKNGFFFPMVQPNRNFPPGSSLREANPSVAEVEKEFRAQIELARRMVPRVSYISGHMGCTNVTPEVQAMTTRIAREYGLRSGRTAGAQNFNAGYANTDSTEVRVAKIVKRLEEIGPGTYIMLDHCAMNTPEIQAMGHPGYEHVAADRWSVVESWTHPKVMEVVKRRGVRLVTYAEAEAQ
jgi:hypothetical protein